MIIQIDVIEAVLVGAGSVLGAEPQRWDTSLAVTRCFINDFIVIIIKMHQLTFKVLRFNIGLCLVSPLALQCKVIIKSEHAVAHHTLTILTAWQTSINPESSDGIWERCKGRYNTLHWGQLLLNHVLLGGETVQ